MQNFNKIHIETLGCRLNQIESESIAKVFLDLNFDVKMDSLSAKNECDADVILSILNTCTVTQKAEQKARRIIRLMLEKYPFSLVIVTGCYAQLAEKEISQIDKRVFVIMGQIKSRISAIPAILNEFLQKNEWNPLTFKQELANLTSVPQEKKFFPENSFKLSASSLLAHSRASLKIQDGCNNNCSYCAIHIARGHSVSLDVQTAIDRVVELENKGYDEVVLTTVNIAQYKGQYKTEYCNFTQLLELLLQNTKHICFRISSLYPEIIDEKFCTVISDNRVQPHFHLSVQSGSNKILQLMNRQYTKEQVINACKMLRKAKNNPFIACDIITGFPGETEQDFNDTKKLCDECQFAWVHSFPFSPRPGTVALKLENKVPNSVSGERSKTLTQWAINQKITYCNQFIGKKLSAIIETVKRPAAISQSKNILIYHAVTENFLHCEILSNNELAVSKKVELEITEVLSERINKGGDIEVSAKIIQKI